MIFEDHHGGKERPTFSRSQYIESILFIEDAKIDYKNQIRERQNHLPYSSWSQLLMMYL